MQEKRPQSSLAGFYREMGDLFGVDLTPSNRYGGFKTLLECWRQYIKSSLFWPILLIDEAREMMTDNLSELRLLGSAEFDFECVLTVILCGDRFFFWNISAGMSFLPLAVVSDPGGYFHLMIKRIANVSGV